MLRCLLVFIILSLSQKTKAQDSALLEVRFLHGSIPFKKNKATEQKWFGGLHGGHVGAGFCSDSIFHFLPKGKFHLIAQPRNKHSKYVYDNIATFDCYLHGAPDSFAITSIFIPVTLAQKKVYDSIAKLYIEHTPYDYAFLGNRCASATYHTLSNIGVIPKRNIFRIVAHAFYPQLLRKKLLRLAKKNKWEVTTKIGNSRRKWEK